jgi:F0F1-type ATP synthase membrane subunit c/vacuolar-type H+-ATPase subunit K
MSLLNSNKKKFSLLALILVLLLAFLERGAEGVALTIFILLNVLPQYLFGDSGYEIVNNKRRFKTKFLIIIALNQAFAFVGMMVSLYMIKTKDYSIIAAFKGINPGAWVGVFVLLGGTYTSFRLIEKYLLNKDKLNN